MTKRSKKHKDPLIEEQIERAMKPYLGVLPQHALDTMREILEDTLETHPVATGILGQLRQRQPVESSGTQVSEDAKDDEAKDGSKEGAG
jgi:hypothetical protein